MEILPFLLAPFLASLILTGIHAYLGVHVVERGVIFVDLALAQIAALGATFAILMGMDPHGSGAYWLSLAFTFAGAAIFAFARTRRGHIPQEAFIGIAYAVASATAILAMSKATGETEHLKDMLVGNILAVSMHDVAKTAILYGVIGIFHYIFRKQFLLISTNPEEAEAKGLSIRFWIFCFTLHLDSWSLLRLRLRVCCWCSVIWWCLRLEPCSSLTGLAGGWRLVGSWEHWCPRWVCIFLCCLICPPGLRLFVPLAPCSSSCFLSTCFFAEGIKYQLRTRPR